VTAETSIYSAELLGEIADDIVNIDRGMRWGYNWSWALRVLGRHRRRALGEAHEGRRHGGAAGGGDPPRQGRGLLVRQAQRGPALLGRGRGGLRPGAVDPKAIFLGTLAERKAVIAQNDGATLYDMGDGSAASSFTPR